METFIQNILGAVGTIPGQGGLLEQFDKRLRKIQRKVMFELLERMSAEDVEDLPIKLYKAILSGGMKRPAFLRFYLPTWRGYDEVFWQALGDYIILALHRVKDLEYHSGRGTIKIEYFVRTSGRIRSPEEIGSIVQRIAYLVENEILPTDFTRFRRMAERRGLIGELSKEEAAGIGALLKLLPV